MTLALDRPGSTENASGSALDTDALVRAHLPLVEHLVREVASRIPSHVDRDELTSAAMYALATSARSFDPSVGTSFGSFASIRIRGALTDELRSMDWASRSVRAKARVVESARAEITQRLGRAPSARELAGAMNMSASELAAVEADVHRAAVQSLQALGPDEGAELLPEGGDGPEALLLRREQLGYLRDAVAELPDRLRTVVEQYFFQQRRMADIAADLGVTESRVSQLRSEALAWLREGMQASGEPRPSIPVPARRGRATKQDAYRAAVAARSTLGARLSATNALGERLASEALPIIA